MPENTGEEHLDNPTNNQSENPPDEIIPAADTETINPIQETENMEVHHHAHDPSAPHHKKNWKSYFWEFLMLFLAVFCGFLAEYQLEHKIEKDREKQYMVSLYQDLKTDTSNMSTLLTGTMRDIANYDSLFDIFKNKKYLQGTANTYYYGRLLVTLRPFYATDGTITQLENSGGLRLIKSRAVVDSLQSYKLAISNLKNIQGFEREHFMLARSLMGKIFDADVFDIMINNSKDSSTLQRPDKNYPLMPFTKAELNDFHVPMGLIKRNKMNQIDLLKRLHKKATDLMKLVQEKYRVNSE